MSNLQAAYVEKLRLELQLKECHKNIDQMWSDLKRNSRCVESHRDSPVGYAHRERQETDVVQQR